MDRWNQKVAIVTGASGGIGLSIAEHLVKAGLKVVGLARRKEKLDEVAKNLQEEKGKFYSFKADITKEEDILDAFKWTTENVGNVHILVNNAGVALDTDLVNGDTQKWKQVLDTNVLGLCIATREAVKIMRTNKIDGHIVHINSVAGHMVPRLNNLNVYAAAKYAVTALTETLRQELNSVGSKIKVSSVSPGFVDTDMVKEEEALQGLEFVPILLPEDVAQAVLYVLGTPPHVQVHELMIRPIGEMA